jgi:hypothetical protein
VPIESDGIDNALVGGSFIDLIDFGVGLHYASCLPAVNGDGFVAKLSL